MGRGRSKCSVARRRAFVVGAGFKDSRILAGLDRHAAAQLLGVTVRTVQNWEMSRCRVPYAAFKLMRILRGLELPGAWSGWQLHRDTLYAPDGKAFEAWEMGYLALVFAMARAWLKARGRAHMPIPGVKGASPLASASHSFSEATTAAVMPVPRSVPPASQPDIAHAILPQLFRYVEKAAGLVGEAQPRPDPARSAALNLSMGHLPNEHQRPPDQAEKVTQFFTADQVRDSAQEQWEAI
jgi:hypothetical protein